MAEVKTIQLAEGVSVTAPNDLSVSSVGGGGGGGLQWNPVAGQAPLEDQENGEKVYLFENGLTQKLTVFLKVPSTYIAGSPINMRLAIYSPFGGDTILMSTTSSLIQEGSDPVSSITNQHVSTNTAVTNTFVDEYHEIVLDITDPDGEMNSIAVEPSDMIRVELTRSTDTDPEDTRFVPSATEVTFS